MLKLFDHQHDCIARIQRLEPHEPRVCGGDDDEEEEEEEDDDDDDDGDAADDDDDDDDDGKDNDGEDDGEDDDDDDGDDDPWFLARNIHNKPSVFVLRRNIVLGIFPLSHNNSPVRWRWVAW